MRKTLAELTSAFAAKASSEGSDASWKLFFNFWKAEPDTVSIVRFLPDLKEDNALGFLVENLSHELYINGKRTKVPCLKMYGENCPICALSQKHYDQAKLCEEGSPEEKKLKSLGKKYYKKKMYLGQVLVLESPIEHDQAQLVKLIEVGPKIFNQIQAAFASGDLEKEPQDLKEGYNFRIKKTKTGEFADYGTSSFSPKQSPVADDVIDSIVLWNLADFRHARVPREVLEAMLLADQTGSDFIENSEAEAPVQDDSVPELKLEVKPEVKTEAVAPVEKELSVIEKLRLRAAQKAAV